MKLTLRLAGFIGFVAFALLFAITFLSPIQIERAARGYIASEIRDRIEKPLGMDAGHKRVFDAIAADLETQHGEKLRALKHLITLDIDQLIADEVARMQDLSCVCRELLQRGLDAVRAMRISELESAAPQLRQIVEGRYVEIVSSLMRDLRIFAGVNAVAFLVLLILSMTRYERIRQIFVPGALLAISVVIASVFYVFGQNWFFVVLQADYVGWVYVVWVCVIFGFLIDIAIFRARATTQILQTLGSAVSTAAPPC